MLKLGSRAARQAATAPIGAALAKVMARWPALMAFYVGRADDGVAAVNQAFDASLRKHGTSHTFRIYPAGHSAALWRAQAPSWLSMALTYLSTGHTVPRHS